MTATAIVVDNREPTWVQTLQFGGVPTMVTTLDAGDCMIATDTNEILLIERKTLDDLLGSIKDGRIFLQAANMITKTRWAYVVITGDIQHGAGGNLVTDRGETGWSFGSVMGAILQLQELGIFVIWCAGDVDYEACVLRIANRSRNVEMLVEPARFPTVLSSSEQIVASLPGIGIERARTIIEAAGGSPAVAISLLTDFTSTFPGIGQGVKNRIRAALRLAELEQLVVTSNNEGRETVQIIKSYKQEVINVE